jgi:hypothetical protein
MYNEVSFKLIIERKIILAVEMEGGKATLLAVQQEI